MIYIKQASGIEGRAAIEPSAAGIPMLWVAYNDGTGRLYAHTGIFQVPHVAIPGKGDGVLRFKNESK